MEAFSLSTVLLGLLVPALVEVVKRIQSIPVSSGQTARIRTVALVLAFLGNAGVAYANGTLATFLSPEVLTVAGQAIVTFVISHIAYKGVKFGGKVIG